MALVNGNDWKNNMLHMLESTTKAYSNLAAGVLAVGNLKKVTSMLEYVISDLKKESKKYCKLIEALTDLAAKYRELETETKAHVRTVKEQASVNAKIFERAKHQSVNGRNFKLLIEEIEQSAQCSLKGSQHLRNEYSKISENLKDHRGQAKKGRHRSELRADTSKKGARVGVLGGLGVGGAIVAFQVATKALVVFGPMGAVVGGALGLVGGAVIGGMAGAIPFVTMEHLFLKYAKNFENIDDALCKINKVLRGNFDALTEICRLLANMETMANNLLVDQDEVDNSSDDDHKSNLDFLIALRFDELERICKDLEGNCQNVLNNQPSASSNGDVDKKQL